MFGNKKFYFSAHNPTSFKLEPRIWPEVEKMRPQSYTSRIESIITLNVSAHKSRPRLQLSNGYPKLISYLETKNFTFQPIIPLCSNSSLVYDPKLRKCGPRTTHLHSQIKTTSTNLKWVSKVDFILGNEEFYFSTHNPTLFKLVPGMWPEVEKMWPKNYMSPLANQDHISNSQMVIKILFHIWKRRILLFKP